MISYQMFRPKPPRHSNQWEQVRWKEGAPLQSNWVMSEADGRNKLRFFFILDDDCLIQPLSDKAAVALSAMFWVEGCKLLRDYREGDKWVFEFVDPNGDKDEFRLPFVGTMAPAEMVESAKPLPGPVHQEALKPKGVLDLQTVSFLSRMPPAAQPTVAAAPVEAEVGSPSITETLGWSKTQLFVEYWKLRAAESGSVRLT